MTAPVLVGLRMARLAAFAAALSVASLAYADLDGQQACLDREAGSSCTRSSGAIGICVAEPTAPGVFTCTPEGGGGAGGSGLAGNGTGGSPATAGSAGYTGSGTGAQGGSVDGPACNVTAGATADGSGGSLLALAFAAVALVGGRRRRSKCVQSLDLASRTRTARATAAMALACRRTNGFSSSQT